MPVDASVYGQIRQPDNPLDTYGKALNLKALMGQSRLQELQTTRTERDLAEEQALHDVFSKAPTGATLESLVPEALRASPKGGIELQGKVLTQKKLQGDIDKTQMELTSKAAELHRDQLANVNDPQAAAQWVQAGYSDPHIAPILSRGGTVEQAVARIPQDPAQFQEWKAKNGMGIQKFLEMQNTNAQHALNRGVTREGHALTERGQNMTDVRQRELNGIMEGQAPTDTSATVDALGKHEIPMPPRPSGARNPTGQARWDKLFADVKTKYPNFGMDQFPTVKKTENDFANGKPAQTIQALSNATGHLDTYQRLALAMQNGDSQAVNAIVNKVRTQFGSAAPTQPQAVAQFLSGEIVKAATGAAGGVTDREHMESVFANKASQAQMVGAADTVREIMGQQFRSLEQRYKSGTYGRTDFADKYLTLPEVRAAYEKANKAHDKTPAAAAQPKALPTGWKIEEVK